MKTGKTESHYYFQVVLVDLKTNAIDRVICVYHNSLRDLAYKECDEMNLNKPEGFIFRVVTVEVVLPIMPSVTENV
jgi:hypothetical protein